MYIYIITLLMCYLFVLLNDAKENSESAKFPKKFFYIIITALMLIIVGFRSDTVGIDTYAYKGEFLRIGRKNFDYLLNDKILNEVGYAFSNILFGKLGLPWEIYKLLMGAIFLIPAFILIYKKTDNPFYALIFFITMGWWTYPMSTIRQSVAIGLTILAFLFEEKNKKLPFISCILLAISFHNSAFIVLIYYVITKIPLNKKNVGIWAVLGLIITLLGITPLRNFVQEIMLYFGKDYSSIENTGGNLMEVFFILTLILGSTFIGKEKDEIYVKYYKAVYLSAVILPIVKINPTLFRIYQYFSIYLVVFIPMMLSRIKDKKIRLIGHLGYNTVCLYLLFTKTLIEINKLIPYSFFGD